MHLKWPPNIKRGTTDADEECKRKRQNKKGGGGGRRGEQDAGKRLLDHTEFYEVGSAYVL